MGAAGNPCPFPGVQLPSKLLNYAFAHQLRQATAKLAGSPPNQPASSTFARVIATGLCRRSSIHMLASSLRGAVKDVTRGSRLRTPGPAPARPVLLCCCCPALVQPGAEPARPPPCPLPRTRILGGAAAWGPHAPVGAALALPGRRPCLCRAVAGSPGSPEAGHRCALHPHSIAVLIQDITFVPMPAMGWPVTVMAQSSGTQPRALVQSVVSRGGLPRGGPQQCSRKARRPCTASHMLSYRAKLRPEGQCTAERSANSCSGRLPSRSLCKVDGDCTGGKAVARASTGCGLQGLDRLLLGAYPINMTKAVHAPF